MNILRKNRKTIIYDADNQNALKSAKLLQKKQEIEYLEDEISAKAEAINRKQRILKALKEKKTHI